MMIAKSAFPFRNPSGAASARSRLKNIHQAYGDKVVYRGIDFQAEREQRIVLVGPNGAGKSTLLKILGGALAPQQGTRELGSQC